MKKAPNPLTQAILPSERTHRVSQLRQDWRAAREAHAELVRLGMPRVNLLLTGTDGAIENLLDVLMPHLQDPVRRWYPGKHLLLPSPSMIGTMIFQDIGALSRADQWRLLEWTESAAGQTQVVSTSANSLLPRLESGSFIEALYYRLNTISLDASA